MTLDKITRSKFLQYWVFWRKGEHPTQSNFNPDFFLKSGDNIIVIEIKVDADDSDENKAKYYSAKKHFETLNEELKKAKIKQRYFFIFWSPSSYTEFTQHLIDGRLFDRNLRAN